MAFCIKINNENIEIPINIINKLKNNPSEGLLVNVIDKISTNIDFSKYDTFSLYISSNNISQKRVEDITENDIVLSATTISKINDVLSGKIIDDKNINNKYAEFINSDLEKDVSEEESPTLEFEKNVGELEDFNEEDNLKDIVFTDVSPEDYKNRNKKSEAEKYEYKENIIVNPTFMFNNLPEKERQQKIFLGINNIVLKQLLNNGFKDFILEADNDNKYLNSLNIDSKDYSIIEVPINFDLRKYNIEKTNYLISALKELSGYGNYVHRHIFIKKAGEKYDGQIVKLMPFSDSYALNPPRTYESIPENILSELRVAGTIDTVFKNSEGEIIDGKHVYKGNVIAKTPNGYVSVNFPTQTKEHLKEIFDNIRELVVSGENLETVADSYNNLVGHISQRINGSLYYKDSMMVSKRNELTLIINYNNQKNVFFFGSDGDIRMSSYSDMYDGQNSNISSTELADILTQLILKDKTTGRKFTPKANFRKNDEKKFYDGRISQTKYLNILKNIQLVKYGNVFNSDKYASSEDMVRFLGYSSVKFNEKGNPIVYRSKYNPQIVEENMPKKMTELIFDMLNFSIVINESYSNEILLSQINNGAKPKYNFFYGHNKSNDGQLTTNCFSNWYPAPFTDGTRTYQTAEHFMMARKAKFFNDEKSFDAILAAPTPKEAKLLGRKVLNFNQDEWDSIKYTIAVTGNLLKFIQHEDLWNFLFATGDEVIVEASPTDTIWGIGIGKNSPIIGDTTNWRGENLLGYALMEVRNILTEQSSDITENKLGTIETTTSIDDSIDVEGLEVDAFRAVDKYNGQIGEKITKEQISKLKTIFPSLENRELQIISDAIQTGYYGKVSEKGLYLMESATTGTMYHEAWHEFSQWYLTKQQKLDLYNQTRKILGENTSNKESEEFLAEEFSKFKLGRNIDFRLQRYFNRTNNIFYKILNFIKSLFSKSNILDEFKKLSIAFDSEKALSGYSSSNIMFRDLKREIWTTNKNGEKVLLFDAVAMTKLMSLNDSLVFDYIFRTYKSNINGKNRTYFQNGISYHPNNFFEEKNLKGIIDGLRTDIKKLADNNNIESWKIYSNNFDLVFNEYIKHTNLPFKKRNGLNLDENNQIDESNFIDAETKERDTASLLQGNEGTVTQDLNEHIKTLLQSISSVKTGVSFDKKEYERLWYDAPPAEKMKYYERSQLLNIPKKHTVSQLANKVFAITANSSTYSKMIKALESSAFENPELWELLDKLPTVEEVAMNMPNALSMATKFEAAKRFKFNFYTIGLGIEEVISIKDNFQTITPTLKETMAYEGISNNLKNIELAMINEYKPFVTDFSIKLPILLNGSKVKDKDKGHNSYLYESFNFSSFEEAIPTLINFYKTADITASKDIFFSADISKLGFSVKEIAENKKIIEARVSDILISKILGITMPNKSYIAKSFNYDFRLLLHSYIYSKEILDDLLNLPNFSKEKISQELKTNPDYLSQSIELNFLTIDKKNQGLKINYTEYENLIHSLKNDVPFKAIKIPLFKLSNQFKKIFNSAANNSTIIFSNTIIDAEGKLRNTLNLYNSLFHDLSAINDLTLNNIEDIVKQYPHMANLLLFKNPSSMLYKNPYLSSVFDANGNRLGDAQLKIFNLGGFQAEYKGRAIEESSTSQLSEIDKILQNAAMHNQFERLTRPGDKSVELGLENVFSNEINYHKVLANLWLNELGFLLHSSIQNGEINYNKIAPIAFENTQSSTVNLLKKIITPELLNKENAASEIIDIIRKSTESVSSVGVKNHNLAQNHPLFFVLNDIKNFIENDKKEIIEKYNRLEVFDIVNSILGLRSNTSNAAEVFDEYLYKKHINYHSQMFLFYGYHGQYENVFKRNSNITSTGKTASFDSAIVSGLNASNRALSYNVVTKLNYEIKKFNFNGKSFDRIQDISAYLKSNKFTSAIDLSLNTRGIKLKENDIHYIMKKYISSFQTSHPQIFNDIEYDPKNPTYKVQVILKKGNKNSVYDYIKKSPHHADIQNSYNYATEKNKAVGINNSMALKKDTYSENNIADAQAWCSFSFYKDFSILTENWSNDQEFLYIGLILGTVGKTYKGKPIMDFFTPKKPQYAGNVPVKINGKIVANNGFYQAQAFDKMSFMPYIPQIFDGTKYEDIGKTMAINNTAYIMTVDARKIGTETVEPILEALGDTYIEGNAFVGHRYFYGLKEQVNIASKDHDVAVYPKQMLQIIQGFAYSENGVEIKELKDLSDTYSKHLKNFATKVKQELYEEIGYNEITGEIDIDKLGDVIEKELETKQSSMAVIEALKVNNGKFVHSIESTSAKQSISSIIYSIFNRRLVSFHVNGDMLVQISSHFLTDNDLLFYKLGTINGTEQTLPATSKIAFRGQWHKLLKFKDENGIIIGDLRNLNKILKGIKEKIASSAYTYEKVGDKLIAHKSNTVFTEFELRFMKATQVSAVRIPTQGFNSMEVFQIEEFLDEKIGGLVVVPSEITTKAGSDFDIDKLVFMYPELFDRYLSKEDEGQINSRKEEIKNELSSIEEAKDARKTLNEIIDNLLNTEKDAIKDFTQRKKRFFLVRDAYLKEQSDLNNEYDSIPKSTKNKKRLNEIKENHATNKFLHDNELNELAKSYKLLLLSGVKLETPVNSLTRNGLSFAGKMVERINSAIGLSQDELISAKTHLFSPGVYFNHSDLTSNYIENVVEIDSLLSEYNALNKAQESKLYHNSLSETIKKIILNKHRYTELVYPNGTDIIGSGKIGDKDMAIDKIETMKWMNKFYPEYNESNELADFRNNLKRITAIRKQTLSATGQAASKLTIEEVKTKGGIQTKKDVGIAAVQVTIVNLLSNLGVHLNIHNGKKKLPLYYFTREYTQKNILNKSLKFNSNTDTQFRVKISDDGLISTEKTPTYLRRAIAEQFLNPILDALNDNNPISQIGINRDTISTIEFMMVYLGMSPEIAYYLLNQPLVQNYIQEKSNKKNKTVELILRKSKEDDNEYSYYPRSENDTIGEYSVIEMFKNIGRKYDDMSKDEQIEQGGFLADWIQFEHFANAYTGLQTSVNWASTKQMDYMSSIHKISQFEQVRKDNFFINIDNIKESVGFNFAIQSDITGFLSKLFPIYSNEDLVLSGLAIAKGTSTNVSQKIFRLFSNDFFSFILQNSKHETLTPLLKGLINTFSISDYGKSFDIRDIETEYKDLYSYLKKEIKTLKEKSDNYFIRSIAFNETEASFNIEINGNIRDIDEQDAISNSMILLNATNKEIVQRLVMFSLLQDGLNKSNISWASLIPPSLYEDKTSVIFDYFAASDNIKELMPYYVALFAANNPTLHFLSKKKTGTIYSILTGLLMEKPFHQAMRFKDYSLESKENKKIVSKIYEKDVDWISYINNILNNEYSFVNIEETVVVNSKGLNKNRFLQSPEELNLFELEQFVKKNNLISFNNRDEYFDVPLKRREYLDWVLINSNNLYPYRRNKLLDDLDSGAFKNRKILINETMSSMELTFHDLIENWENIKSQIDIKKSDVFIDEDMVKKPVNGIALVENKKTKDEAISFGSNAFVYTNTSKDDEYNLNGLGNGFPISILKDDGTKWEKEDKELFEKTIDNQIRHIIKSKQNFNVLILPKEKIGSSVLLMEYQDYLNQRLSYLGIDNTNSTISIAHSIIIAQDTPYLGYLLSPNTHTSGNGAKVKLESIHEVNKDNDQKMSKGFTYNNVSYLDVATAFVKNVSTAQDEILLMKNILIAKFSDYPFIALQLKNNGGEAALRLSFYNGLNKDSKWNKDNLYINTLISAYNEYINSDEYKKYELLNKTANIC